MTDVLSQSWHVAMAAAAHRVFQGGLVWAAEHDASGLQLACHKGLAALEARDGEALVEALIGVGHYGRDPQFRAKAYQVVRNLRTGRQRRASRRGVEARRKVRNPALVAARVQQLKDAGMLVKLIDCEMQKEFGIGYRQAYNYWKKSRELP